MDPEPESTETAADEAHGPAEATPSSDAAAPPAGVRRQPLWTYFLTPGSILIGALIVAGSIWISVERDDDEDAGGALDTTGGVSGLPADSMASLEDVMAGYARDIGLDEGEFEQCMSTETTVDILNTHIGRARSYGVSATPTFMINDKKVTGAQPPSVFEEIIQGELEGGRTSVDQYSDSIQQLAAAGRFEIAGTRPDVSDADIEGDPEAEVIIAEFSDFQCPFCKRWVDQTLGTIREQLGEDVALAFVHFPIQQLHPNAPYAHVVSVCASEQDKFWEMHDVLFARQEEWAELSR